MAVSSLGGLRAGLDCFAGRGLAFSFASLVRLRILTVVLVLSLSALGTTLLVAIYVFLLRGMYEFVGLIVLDQVQIGALASRSVGLVAPR